MRRVVLDTNILVSAAIMPKGKSDQILRQAGIKFELLTSEYILLELARVLARTHIQRKYRDRVTLENQKAYFVALWSLAQVIETQTTLDVVVDPKDNAVLACAVDGRAHYLVTGDPHLLALQKFQDIQIVTPAQFLKILVE